jgi:hypothetical protein
MRTAGLGRAALTALGLASMACSGGDDEGAAPSVAGSSSLGGSGAGGSGAGGSGAGGSGAGGVGGGTSTAGAGGTTAGTAGAGGKGSKGGCPDGLQEFSAEDANLTLGGLNAELPEPSVSCLTAEPDASTCVALSIVIDGTPRELVCTRMGAQATNGTGVTCSTSDGESVSLLTQNFGGITPPGTFVAEERVTTFGGLLQLRFLDAELTSGSEGFVETRVAGWVNKWVSSSYCRSASWGVIAATWTGSELGDVRVRGTFHTRSY